METDVLLESPRRRKCGQQSHLCLPECNNNSYSLRNLASWRELCRSWESEDKSSVIITDQNGHLPLFCNRLEEVLLCRLKASRRSLFGVSKLEIWQLFLTLSKHCNSRHLSKFFDDITERIKRCNKLKTYQGRGRAFIRLALTKGLLANVVQTIADSTLVTSWYEPDSILLSHSVRQNLLDILNQVSDMTFDLTLAVQKLVQLPYSTDIGILVRHIDNRAVVVKIQPQSPASDTGIEPGDILDQVFGESLYMINSILRKYQDQSIPILIIKKNLSNGMPFDPITRRLDQIFKSDNLVVGQEIPKSKSQQIPDANGECCPLPSLDETPVQAPDDGNLFSVVYVGSTNMGNKGDKAYIEEGIKEVINQQKPDTPVSIELNEGYLTARSKSSNEAKALLGYLEIQYKNTVPFDLVQV
ncbi:uncharacterized protein TRIADDRAFT_53941 [Trichoplax adhaerens]|uniref:RUN domain-containing protein n=1 Tax=Trichoplax adhaerens TaxID=10228 RepID=B3RMG0_TRIAD|nr:predicted protein [Trichoplax adhaerens]EDV28358.1 predicted protein [Trichoplax adhaerens]|eukprot:XP_002110192.1 predicted protein [Trichoplax adhaerens]